MGVHCAGSVDPSPPVSKLNRIMPIPQRSGGSASYGPPFNTCLGWHEQVRGCGTTHFRGNVGDSSTLVSQEPRLACPGMSKDSGQAKIRDLQRVGGIQENVLKLDVPVTDAFAVDVHLG